MVLFENDGIGLNLREKKSEGERERVMDDVSLNLKMSCYLCIIGCCRDTRTAGSTAMSMYATPIKSDPWRGVTGHGTICFEFRIDQNKCQYANKFYINSSVFQH